MVFFLTLKIGPKIKIQNKNTFHNLKTNNNERI